MRRYVEDPVLEMPQLDDRAGSAIAGRLNVGKADVVGELEDSMAGLTNVFVEDHATLLYRKYFEQSTRILVRDGFKRRRNADYPAMEEFSDLHVTYGDLGMAGFGDFLIVGDVYSEGGGPAYAVAIHLTFIDPDKDDVMYVYHFVSDIAAREAVLVAQPLEDPPRRMPLLHRACSVGFQDRVDHPQQRPQLRLLHRLRV